LWEKRTHWILDPEPRDESGHLNPSVKSSLTFLRRTPWARAKVEALYIAMRTEDSGR